MDSFHEGLQAVLSPEVRAGVHGEALTNGRFAIGDSICVVE
jgi:hypothetical protein